MRSTIASASIRRCNTVRRKLLSSPSGPTLRRALGTQWRFHDEFLRHTEIYRSDVLTGFTPGKVPPPVDRHSARVKRRDGRSAPDFIVFDEFPAGYSSAGCSPAEPASASPTTASLLPPPIQAPHKTVEWYLCNQQVSQARGSVQYAFPSAPKATFSFKPSSTVSQTLVPGEITYAGIAPGL